MFRASLSEMAGLDFLAENGRKFGGSFRPKGPIPEQKIAQMEVSSSRGSKETANFIRAFDPFL